MSIRTRATAAWNSFWNPTPTSSQKSAGGTGKVSQIIVNASRSASYGTDSNMDYFMRLAVSNPWFFSAIRTVSERLTNVAKFNMQIMRDGQWETIENHPFNTVLSRPNSLMTGGLLLGSVSEWMDAAGESYWFLVTDRPGRGPVNEIWLLPTDRIQPDPRTVRISPFTGKVVVDYRYTMGGQIMLPGENVVHFRTPNLFDFWRGTSPLTALQSVLQTDASQASWLGSFFGEDNAVPTAVISLPPTLEDVEFDTVKKDIESQFGAQRRAAITRAGDMSVEVIQHSIDEMKVIDGMNFNAEAIRAVLRVPKMSDLVSGASRLAADMALMRDAVQPKLDLFASFITLKICPFYEEYPGQLRCVAENIVPQDRAVEATVYNTYAPDRTLNENRKEQKLKPLVLPPQLADYQALFDVVPQRYVMPFIKLLGEALQGQSVETSTQFPSDKELIAFLSGQRPTRQLTQSANRQLPKPAPEMGERTSGLPTQRQLMRQLTGMEM